FNYNRGSFTFFTFHEYKFTKSFTFNLQAFLRSKALQNFYELNTFGGMVVSANKSMLKRKANLILSVNDVLQTNRVVFQFDRNNQNINGKRINDTRKIGITFRYNFGLKPKEEKKNSFEAPAEAKE
ncbi:MAG: outer membrane beta-barrel protein, partial [Sphingobacteriales bacterium]|nr:outer membrane beta-barrel protein [Sphingobacteriales bacterium]